MSSRYGQRWREEDRRLIVSLRVIMDPEVEEVDPSDFADSCLEALQAEHWAVERVDFVDQSLRQPFRKTRKDKVG